MTATTRRGLLVAAVGTTGASGLAAALRTQLLLLSCDEAVLARSRSYSLRTRALVTTLRDHARAHVTALRDAGARGGGSVLSPGPALDRALARERITGRPDHLRGERDALNLLLDAERVAIGAAYLALGEVHDPATSTLLAQLMASGAQHEAALHLALHPGDIAGAIPYGIVQGVR